MSDAISDEDAFALLRASLAADDDVYLLWPKQSVEYARSLYMRARGSVPSPGEILLEIGEGRAKRMLPDIVSWRKFDNALKGHGSPCHYCGSDKELIFWDFALMQVASSKIAVGSTLVSAALSAVTLPFFGVGTLRLPGRSQSGAALHLKLVTCKVCCRKEGNMLGLFLLNEQRASRHPLWKELSEHGFTKFLPEKQMPDEFKYDFGQRL